MESLENNLFFQTLTTTFKKRYQEIIENCYHICIPINGSYDPKQLNDKFICSHILKPSMLLKSHFLPYNNKQNFQVHISDKLVKVTKGFGDQNHTTIRILNEEQAYNNANKKYSIFICEQPLISSLNSKLNYESFNISSRDVELVSFEDCKKFLGTISKPELSKLKSEMNLLMDTYIIIPGYLNDLAMKLKKMIDFYILSFTNIVSNKNNSIKCNRMELISSTVESYSIGLIYDKLIDLTKKNMSKQDELFLKEIRNIKKQKLNLTYFGAQKVFEKFTVTKTIMDKFNELDNHNTPLSKLNCMRQTLDAINDQLKKTVDEHKSPFDNNSEKIYIMSDDLISAVICVLASCEPINFCSNIEFIHSFSWYLPQNSELGYSLVTFEVAKEYLVNYNNQELKLEKNNKKLYDDSFIVKNEPINSEYSSLDYEIDKITKLLGNTNKYNGSNSTSNHLNEDLGGFLSSLAENFTTVSGQKF